MVYYIQQIFTQHIKDTLQRVTKFEYFSDGCAVQYKNRKNLYNLCQHKSDFGIEAVWNFFATSHGKSPCDGIGGTVKRVTARTSLQRARFNHILTPGDINNFCSSTPNLSAIKFFYIQSNN